MQHPAKMLTPHGVRGFESHPFRQPSLWVQSYGWPAAIYYVPDSRYLNQYKNPMQTQTAETHISWKIPEYREHERSKKWYIIAIALLALLLIYAILTANFLFAIILIVVGITFSIHDRRSAEHINFEILENGIQIGNKKYSYNAFKSFWMYYEPEEAKTLFFEFKNKIRPRLSFPLENKNPLKIRAILLKYLPEDIEKENEPLSEQLSRLLKL